MLYLPVLLLLLHDIVLFVLASFLSSLLEIRRLFHDIFCFIFLFFYFYLIFCAWPSIPSSSLMVVGNLNREIL